jgi:hypothetical protein
VFASSFAEGDAAAAAAAAKLEALQLNDKCTDYYPRRIIPMEDDFDILHNVLYYLYTKKISFSTKGQHSYTLGFNSPKICDAEDIYAIAHRLDLRSLQKKALAFLRWSNNPRNITARVFSKYASVYEEIGAIYNEYFRKNWIEIRDTPEFSDYFTELEEAGDGDEANRVLERYRELMKAATFPS